MSKTTINLPPAGKKAIVKFSLDAMEKLSEEFGLDYIATTIRRLDLCDPTVLRICFDTMVVNGEKTLAETLEKVTAESLAFTFGDAMMRSIRGKSIAEINAENVAD